MAGGWDPERVADRAVRTSPGVRLSYAELEAAAAGVDQALVAFFPVLSTSFGYTRLSEVENVSTFDPGIPGIDPIAMEFPVHLDNWLWKTQIAVPISDYLLRLTQAYASASKTEKARGLEARAKELQVAADAKVAFFNWARALGQAAVAELAVEQARAHLGDARKTLEVGLISRADLLRLEAQVAQAEHLARAAGAFRAAAEELLRTVLHLSPDAQLGLGIDVMQEPAPDAQPPLAALQRTALAQRLELRAMDAAQQSLAEAEALSRASYYPRLDGFFGTDYARPNSRVFLEEEASWELTWQAGLSVSWTVNETFSTLGKEAEIEAQQQALAAQQAELRDGIKLAVTQAYYDVVRARSAILATRPRERAAAESLRVRRDLLRVGKATATDMVDAETELTQARLQRVDAHVDFLIAQARLEHATGSK